MKVKIAHCADIHLGVKNTEKSSESRETFCDMLDLCKAENVDFLVISGDLFDDVTLSPKISNWVKAELKKFGVKTVISPGNHDPFTSDCPYKEGGWPENVFIFKENKLTYFDFPENELRIWGGAFTGIYQREPIFQNGVSLPENLLNICVMHATVASGSEVYYNPLSLKKMEESRFDYIALGHIHKRSKAEKVGSTFYAYPGSLCPSGFGDTGEKGIYIGEISKSGVKLEFRKVCKHAYEKLSVDISGTSDSEEVAKKILGKISSGFGEDFAANSYEITLQGELGEDFALDLTELSIRLNRDLHFASLADKTEAKVDLQALTYRTDFKSIFIKKAIQRIEKAESDEEKTLCKNALKLGLRAFDEGVIYCDN